MKLSNKGRYAVRALFDIAYFNDGKPTQVKDIAERQGIPPRFLEQIFQDLKRAGLVGSKRGPQGGYSLLAEPRDISLGRILRVTEGSVALTDEREEESSPGPESALGITEEVFERLSNEIQACFDAINLATLCELAQQRGLKKSGAPSYVYMI